MNPNNTLNTNKMFKIARNNNLLLRYHPFSKNQTPKISKNIYFTLITIVLLILVKFLFTILMKFLNCFSGF